MKKPKLAKIITMFSFVVTLTFCTNIYAMNTDVELSVQLETKVYNFIDDIAQSEMFCDWVNADIVMKDIYSYTKDSLKVYKLDVMENNLQLGYILSDEAGNIICYNGNFSLIKNDTFNNNNVKTSMRNSYIYNGGLRNDTTPKAFEVYIRAKGLFSVYSSDVNLYWYQNATKELMISEVNEGKPMILGFAAGSIYSDSVGHMTMCYGYQVTGGNTYAYVASGHEAYGTFVKWDDTINDCIITIRIY